MNIVQHDMRLSPDASKKAWDALLAEISAANGQTAAVVLFQDLRTQQLHHSLQRYMGDQKAMVRGYALLVSGSTRLDGRYGSTHILGPQLGAGTSRYRITSDNVSADTIRARWKKLHDEQSPELPSFDVLQESFSAGAYIISDPSTTKPSLCLIIHAGDTPAALAAIESRQRKPKTVAEFFKSKRYHDLIKSSQDVRDQIADRLARALEIDIDEEADVTVLTNAIIPAERVAHQSAGQEDYVILVDGFDTSSAHQGVLVAQGPMGGFALVQKTRAFTLANGSQSRGWKTESMSALSANAPAYDEATSSGEAALHRNANAAARTTFSESVFWNGTLQTPHTRADERTTLVTQALVHATAKPQGSKDDELRVVQHQMIAVQLPDHHALSGLTLKELHEHAKATGAKSLPVPLDSEAMRELTRHFDSLQLAEPQELADVFKNSVSEPANDLHTVRSACHSTDPQHYHYWYNEREESDSDSDSDDDDESSSSSEDEPTTNQGARLYYNEGRYYPRRYHPRAYHAGHYHPVRRTNIWLDAALIAALAGAAATAPLAYGLAYE